MGERTHLGAAYWVILIFMANQQPPPYPSEKKGLIRSYFKGNQWLLSPDYKAFFLAVGERLWGAG